VKLRDTLITYINYLHNIRIQHLEEHRNIPDRSLTSPADLKMMTDLTNILYQCIDSAIKNSEESSARFHKAVKLRFTKKKLIKTNA